LPGRQSPSREKGLFRRDIESPYVGTCGVVGLGNSIKRPQYKTARKHSQIAREFGRRRFRRPIEVKGLIR